MRASSRSITPTAFLAFSPGLQSYLDATDNLPFEMNTTNDTMTDEVLYRTFNSYCVECKLLSCGTMKNAPASRFTTMIPETSRDVTGTLVTNLRPCFTGLMTNISRVNLLCWVVAECVYENQKTRSLDRTFPDPAVSWLRLLQHNTHTAGFALEDNIDMSLNVFMINKLRRM